MSTPPPLPGSRGTKSFFHTAAIASLMAVPLAIVMGILSSAATSQVDVQMRATVGMITGWTSLLILVLGCASGIVALFGIPRYGAKGILGRALCGILIPLVLMALAIPAVLGVVGKGNQRAFDKQLTAVAESLNKQKGILIDEETRLEGAEALPGRQLVYKYTLISTKKDDISTEVFFETIRPGLLNTYKNHPEMKALRENGVTLTYRYHDSEGALLGETSVGPADLEGAPR